MSKRRNGKLSYGKLSVEDYQEIIGETRRSSRFRALALAPLLVLCAAGGFSGGMMWDGASSDTIPIEEARTICIDSLPSAFGPPAYPDASVRAATHRVAAIARLALETLIQIRDEAEGDTRASAAVVIDNLESTMRTALRD